MINDTLLKRGVKRLWWIGGFVFWFWLILVTFFNCVLFVSGSESLCRQEVHLTSGIHTPNRGKKIWGPENPTATIKGEYE
jgi:hypothetical protein